MRVMITRPREDAEALAGRLAEDGIESLIEPLLEIIPRAGETLDLDDVQALMLTSANGARALGRATDRRDLAVYAVGPATAAAARAAGFTTVATAGGDVEALSRLSLQVGLKSSVYWETRERNISGAMPCSGAQKLEPQLPASSNVTPCRTLLCAVDNSYYA